MSLTNQEKETIIRFDETGSAAQIETFNGRLIRRLEELSRSRPEDCRKCSGPDSNGAYRYEFPSRWIRVNPPRVSGDLTEEERAKRAERLIAARQNRRNGRETPDTHGNQTNNRPQAGK